MCGIAGLWNARKEDEPIEVLSRMTRSLAHRGPDDQGVWFDPNSGIGMGHRRLSIIDLSPDGHQPMCSGSGRYVMVFNGEIYNFAELRSELPDERWRGKSDTEVMLSAIEKWGLRQAIARFVGMFAFAVWDREAKRLHLVRDRMGIKPLYFGCAQGTLLFGSELKALQAHPDFAPEISRSSLALMMQYNYIPTPYSIFCGIHKLQPGTIATFSGPAVAPEMTEYWSTSDVAVKGSVEPFRGSEREGIAELDRLLRDAISLRMIADVPLGAFLSGGVDSSLVVALMQEVSHRPVRTYTIGFDDSNYNEAIYAKTVAERLGTLHTELYVTAEETQRSIPDLPHYYDEPFADASQLPTLLVSKLARSDVTVALSGDGGDELFGGYNRHLWLTKIARFNRFAPFFARRALSRVLRQVGAQVPSDRSHAVVAAVQRGLRLRNLGLKADKLAPLLLLDGSEEMYERVIATWNDAAEVVIGEVGPQKSNDRPLSSGFHRDGAAAMMLMDLTSYLPDGVLTKIDRASMSVGLEARVPLLDHRIVEFALRLPLGWKIRSGKGKWILRELLSRHLPRKIFERPKAGFGIPIGGWLRGPLRNWAEDLLDEAKLDREGFLNTRRVRSVWEQHLKGKGDWQQHLWCVLMFEAWLGAQSKISTTRNHHEPLTVSGLPLSSVAR